MTHSTRWVLVGCSPASLAWGSMMTINTGDAGEVGIVGFWDVPVSNGEIRTKNHSC